MQGNLKDIVYMEGKGKIYVEDIAKILITYLDSFKPKDGRISTIFTPIPKKRIYPTVTMSYTTEINHATLKFTKPEKNTWKLTTNDTVPEILVIYLFNLEHRNRITINKIHDKYHYKRRQQWKGHSNFSKKR